MYLDVKMISIIIPTYEERDNIVKLIPAIHDVLNGYDYELIIVDDNSPDGTANTAEALSNIYPIRVLRRDRKLGLASAILHGFQNSRGEILGVIDADLQHPPEYIKKFISSILNGCDITIGSRYATGGKIENWSRYRTIVSKCAIILSGPLTNIKDPTSGYFFLKKNVIESIEFSSIGYKILLEILIKGSYKKIEEIPYTFRSRENGNSKLDKYEYINYLKLLYHLYSFKLDKMFKGSDQVGIDSVVEQKRIND